MSETQMILTLVGSMAIGILNYIITAIAYWKIFTKAGEAGWKGIIPLLNSYTLFKISWKTVMFWIMLALSLVYGFFTGIGSEGTMILALVAWIGILVISIIQMVKLSKAFGHGVGFAVGLIFLPIIFVLILAFGSSQYVGKYNN